MILKEWNYSWDDIVASDTELSIKRSFRNNTVNTVSKADLFVAGCKSIGICNITS